MNKCELFQIVLGLAVVRIDARSRLVIMPGLSRPDWPGNPACWSSNSPRSRVLHKPVGHRLDVLLFQPLAKVLADRRPPACMARRAGCRSGGVSCAAISPTTAHAPAGPCRCRHSSRDFPHQLRKTDVGVLHHRLHAVDRFQAFVDAHGIKDAKTFLADLVAFARSAPQHLLVEDAAVHAAQEHQIADRTARRYRWSAGRR
jgi:hypothetical protein